MAAITTTISTTRSSTTRSSTTGSSATAPRTATARTSSALTAPMLRLRAFVAAFRAGSAAVTPTHSARSAMGPGIQVQCDTTTLAGRS